MMVSFILCLFPVLLATASAQGVLTCDFCFGTTETCENPISTCTVPKATGGCITVAEESMLDGKKISGYLKACIDDSDAIIKGPISFTGGSDLYLRINTTKCNDADKCNSAVLGVPKETTTLNGLQCPTCFALNANSCDSKIMPCTGDENYCIDFAGTVVRGPHSSKRKFAAQSCATASAQDIAPEYIWSSALYTFTFTKATSRPAEKTPTKSGDSPAL